MLLRNVLAIGNVVGFITLILVLHEFPQLDTGPVLYLILGWMVGSLVLLYGPWGNRPVGSRPRPPATPVSAALPGGPADVPFCIYCAAPIASGTPVCPTCGHAAPNM